MKILVTGAKSNYSYGHTSAEVRHPQDISDTSALEGEVGGRKPVLGMSVHLGMR